MTLNIFSICRSKRLFSIQTENTIYIKIVWLLIKLLQGDSVSDEPGLNRRNRRIFCGINVI